ncbi:MAG: hypothetical protein D6812_12750 [Deltaproteobacteria bacterium]|nr:MAG: hypothetical protein D6812_12750 [Deltaproteobacteria bacterium]
MNPQERHEEETSRVAAQGAETTTEETECPETHGEEERRFTEMLPPFLQERMKGLDETISKIEEQARQQWRRLNEIGDQAQEDGRKFWKNLLDRTHLNTEEIEKWIDGMIERVITRMNLPTKGDIEGMNEKLDRLSRKIDEVRRAQKRSLAATDEKKTTRPRKTKTQEEKSA